MIQEQVASLGSCPDCYGAALYLDALVLWFASRHKCLQGKVPWGTSTIVGFCFTDSFPKFKILRIQGVWDRTDRDCAYNYELATKSPLPRWAVRDQPKRLFPQPYVRDPQC